MGDPKNGDNFGNVYSDKGLYEAALAEWQRKKAAGDPFPGPAPRMDGAGMQAAAIKDSGYPMGGIPNQAMWVGATRAGANAAPNENPYSTVVANQARPAQEALYAQMRAQQSGPSLAAMQGARSQGQNVQAALGAGAGRPVMAQAGSIGAGLASDTGSGVLAEQIRSSQGIGSMAAGVRAADLGVAGAQSNTGMQQRGLDDAMKQFYAQQGAGLNNTIGRNELEGYKLRERVKLDAQKKEAEALQLTMKALAGSLL